MDYTQTISLRGELLRLLPEKLIDWPARRTLFVADTHFGKAATFRSHGIPVPETTHTTLDRLSRAIAEARSERLIVLGDLVHSSVKANGGFERALGEWRRGFSDLEIVLARGNHDRGRSDLFDMLDIRVVPQTLADEPFQFAHATESLDDASLYGLVGHVHPQIQLSEGKKKLRIPCFWFGQQVGVLPAFGDFTGCATVKPSSGDRAFVIADGRVIEIPCP